MGFILNYKDTTRISREGNSKAELGNPVVLCCGGEMAKLVLVLSGLDEAEYPKPEYTSSLSSQWLWEKYMTNGT